ncbi:alpha/beta fold hydrolase [Xanthobacter sp. KR7-225]|uniref:alpha/beta hydrolase n=1 Tax=Xanthobacter sp. KR7-225 TaxID=3156613 RepID=UPI0032B4FC4F
MHSRRQIAALLLAGLPVSAVRAAPALLETGWQKDGLSGSLLAPRRARRALGVLMVAGSGPTDRDGNGPGLATDLYRSIATGLATAGHVVLCHDKRGVGASRALAGREADITFALLEADARAALRALATRPDVRGVVPLGHSEGAMIAARLARTERVAGLVLMAPPGRPLGTVLLDQLAASGLPPALLEESRHILAMLARGDMVAGVSPALAPLFRPSVQPYLVSVLGVDPAGDLAAVPVPTLIIAAGRDLQAGASDIAALTIARPAARLVRSRLRTTCPSPCPRVGRATPPPMPIRLCRSTPACCRRWTGSWPACPSGRLAPRVAH